MEQVPTRKIESPAWQNPAPGNEQNDNARDSVNETIKTGGNSRAAEDDPDLDKQPYRDEAYKKQNTKKNKRDEAER